MNRVGRSIYLLTLVWSCLTALAAVEPPADWIEPATGHRVVRLAREAGSVGLYFHQNACTTEGDKLLIVTPADLSTVHHQTRDLELVVPGAR